MALSPRSFNLIGAVSTLSLFFAALHVLPGAVRGDFSAVRDFFVQNPGVQPFLVFFFPVIVIASGAWLWTFFGKRPQGK